MSSSTGSNLDAKIALPKLGGRSVTDLVWFQTSFIGDVVLTTAAMAEAQRAWPGIRQSVLTTETGAAVLGHLPRLEQTFRLAKRGGLGLAGMRSVASALRAWRRQLPPDRHAVILQAHKSFRSSMVSRMAGMPVITYRESSRLPFWLMRGLTLVDRVVPLHEAARIGMLLEPLGLIRNAIVAARPELGVERRDSSNRSREGAVRIAMAPGSVWGTKRWSPERFARLAIELLAQVPQARLVLTGSPEEAPLCAAIERKISDRSRVENLAGKTSLKICPVCLRALTC